MSKQKQTYDQAIAELQTIQHRLESGQLGLEDMRDQVARAMELIQWCRQRLRTIQDEVTQLVDDASA
ncbi:MAG: exodeoxyribonuclease VII small subunit [Saprospiraceae bacterium]